MAAFCFALEVRDLDAEPVVGGAQFFLEPQVFCGQAMSLQALTNHTAEFFGIPAATTPRPSILEGSKGPAWASRAPCSSSISTPPKSP